MISKILVPTDGSERAERAGEYAISLAKQTNASVIFLSVVDEEAIKQASRIADAGILARLEKVVEDYNKAAEEYVGKLKKKAYRKVKSEAVVRAGLAADEIIKEAEESKADLIVMGSHGRNALASAVLGSVALKVIHKSKIPVLVVRS